MMTDKHKKLISAAGIALFLLLSLAIFWFVGKPFLAFVSEPEKFRLWVDGHGIWGRLAFLGMMLLQVFVAIIPGEPLEIGAGYAFGAVEGTILCILGAGIGSALVFSSCGASASRLWRSLFPGKRSNRCAFSTTPSGFTP